MKSKFFSPIWRVAIALVLVLSLGLIMAVPAAASGTDGNLDIAEDYVASGQFITITVTDSDLDTSGSADIIIARVISTTEGMTPVTNEAIGSGVAEYTTELSVDPDAGTDNNRIEVGDFTYTASAGSETLDSVSRNSNGTVTLTLSETTTDATATVSYLAAETALLTETGDNTGIFEGTKTVETDDVVGTLRVADGDTIEASYYDVDNSGTERTHESNVDTAEADTVAPVLASAATVQAGVRDPSGDSIIDLVFTEDGSGLDIATIAATDFSIGGTILDGTGDSVSLSGTTVTLTYDASTDGVNALDTGDTPEVILVVALSDLVGNEVTSGTKTPADGIAPVAVSAAYKDTNSDATVDRVDVTYSESIATSTFETGDWTFPTNPHSLGVGSGTFSGTDVQITVTGAPSNNTALDTTTVKYTDTGTTGSIKDGTNNEAATSSVLTVSDAAAPVVIDAVAEDTNENGYLDKITLTMSETVVSNNPTTAAFGVDDSQSTPLTEDSVGAGGTATGGSLNFSSTSSTVVVELSDDTGKTGVPTLTYTSGQTTEVQDSVPNVLATVTPTVTDSARPTIMDLDIYDTNADAKIDKIIVTFSEDIDTDDSVAPVAADFDTITLPDGSTADLSGATIPDPDGSAFTVSITGITGQVTLNTAAGSTGISGDLSANWKDVSNNTLVSTLDDETVTDSAIPVIIDREAQLGSAKATVKFSEPVYSVNDGTGALDKDDFAYPNESAGDATSVSSVSHLEGGAIAVLTLDLQATSSDIGADTIAAASGEIYDVVGLNAATTAVVMIDGREALSLVDGWNLVSIPKVASGGWDIASNAPSLTSIYTYDNGGWGTPVTDADSLDAVFIKADGPQELALEWWTADTQIAPPTKALEAGWNLVGANMDPPTETDVLLHEFLDSVSTSYSTVFNPGYNLISPWTVVSSGSPFTEKVLPYEGYWLYMTTAAELAGRST